MKPLVGDMKTLEVEIKREAQAIFDDGVGALPDKKGRMILAMCSMVLAAYHQLKHRLDDPSVAFDTVRLTFERTYPTPMRWSCRLWLRMFRDPVGRLQQPKVPDHFLEALTILGKVN